MKQINNNNSWDLNQCQISKSKFQINVKYQIEKTWIMMNPAVTGSTAFCHLDFIWHLSFGILSIPACPG